MADDNKQVGQDEIEKLLAQAQDVGAPAETPAPETPASGTPAPADDTSVGQSEIEAMLNGGASAAAPASPSAPADNTAVDQSEIEALLNGGAAPTPPVAPVASAPAPPPAPAPTAASPVEADVSQSDIELLLNKAEEALASIDQGADAAASALPAGVRSFEFQKFAGTSANADSATLELMRDVQLDMTIELGRTNMHLEDVLQLKQGTVVPLDKLAGDPADILVNGRLVARGEVLVLNDNFCVRVAELVVGESACA
ncbi:MAG: flagellar motor switch protein FliN [Henriciella sp.]|nr:flagellar motor switch protein FliN [Henriciella sp.]